MRGWRCLEEIGRRWWRAFARRCLHYRRSRADRVCWEGEDVEGLGAGGGDRGGGVEAGGGEDVRKSGVKIPFCCIMMSDKLPKRKSVYFRRNL